MKIVITGAFGFVGWHLRAHLRAHLPDARVVAVGRGPPMEPAALAAELWDATHVVHGAGVNRADPQVVEGGNVALATTLAQALEASAGSARRSVVYLDSIHSGADSPYGRGKRGAREILERTCAATGDALVTLALPGLFGEFGRPHYNSVVATFCASLASGAPLSVNEGASVELLHVQDAADEVARHLRRAPAPGTHRVTGQRRGVSELATRLGGMLATYRRGVLPDLADRFDVALFNTLRSYLPEPWAPFHPKVHSDARGSLFEAVKGGAPGQVAFSWTNPGFTRGNHFHTRKVERFVVLEGQARVRFRKLFQEGIATVDVSGERPTYIDAPTFYTHSIENVGPGRVQMMFWTHEIFDPANPDTFAEPVLGTTS